MEKFREKFGPWGPTQGFAALDFVASMCIKSLYVVGFTFETNRIPEYNQNCVSPEKGIGIHEMLNGGPCTAYRGGRFIEAMRGPDGCIIHNQIREKEYFIELLKDKPFVSTDNYMKEIIGIV